MGQQESKSEQAKLKGSLASSNCFNLRGQWPQAHPKPPLPACPWAPQNATSSLCPLSHSILTIAAFTGTSSSQPTAEHPLFFFFVNPSFPWENSNNWPWRPWHWQTAQSPSFSRPLFSQQAAGSVLHLHFLPLIPIPTTLPTLFLGSELPPRSQPVAFLFNNISTILLHSVWQVTWPPITKQRLFLDVSAVFDIGPTPSPWTVSPLFIARILC